MSPTLTAAVGAAHQHDLRRAADGSRLAALARCCRPSAWLAALTRLRATVAPRRSVACCA